MDEAKLRSLLISSETTLKQAMQKLSETAEQILFVTNEYDILLGTVTDGDIRGGIVSGMPLTTFVREVMQATFISVHEKCPDIRKQAKELM
jgi:signal-transduction protein with cAMP-binding, CBS, and nucleotidyltransferase domain